MPLFEVRDFQVNKNTSTEQMIANLHGNMGVGYPMLKLRRACIAGSGPSLRDHVEDIRKDQEDGYLTFALNGAARYLSEHDICPDYHVFYDARPENIQFITGREAGCYLVASHVSPDILTALDGRNVQLFHAHAAGPLLSEIRQHYPRSHVLGGAHTVGLLMLNILITMGFRKAKFYGYDSCNSTSGDHHAFDQPMNDDRKYLTFQFRDKSYTADPAMAMQAREFAASAADYERLGLHIDVIGTGLLPDMWRAAREAPPLSTGEQHIDQFIERCGITPGTGVIDFGCGTGRAAQKLHSMGVVVLGIDRAAYCLDRNVTIPFCESLLWSLPEIPAADWGYCCGVLEHMLVDHVHDVIAGIASRVKQGAFFSVCLSCRSTDEWLNEIGQHFPSVEHADGVFIARL